MRYVELRRHTDNDGDALTPDGVAAAEAIGRDRLHPPYAMFVSTGAARATQMLDILRHAAGQDDARIMVAAGLRSSVEDRWRQAARAAGRGADVEACGRSTRTWSSGTPGCSVRRCDRWWRACPTAPEPWWSVTVRRMRPPCWDSRAGSSARSARARASC
jgi:broad specificity phosphatase PhoE